MDYASLKHSPERVRKALHADKKDQTIVALEPVTIYFPKHWMESGMGHIDDRFNVMAFFAIVVDGHFCSTDAMAIMPLTPDEVNTIKIDDGDYYELKWEKGGVICPNRFLVKDGGAAYEVFLEFISKGKTPWYMSVERLANLFRTAKLHAGANLAADPSILSNFTAFRCRDMKNPKKYFRETLQTQSDLDTRPQVNSLNSVAGNATNTTAKLLGANFSEGVVSAVINQSQNNEALEDRLLA